MNDGLKASDREAIRGVLAQFSAIQKAVLFGSRATGTYSPASDIDLVLYGDSLTLSDEFRIASSMEELDLPLRVDLVRHVTITSKELLDHIHRDGKLFYEAKGGRGKAGLGMGGELLKRTVGDYATLQRGSTYKGSLVGEPGPALLGLGSIEPGGGFRHGQYKTYGGDCPANLMLRPGDIYAALKGATKDGKMIGSVARVPATVPSGRLTQDTVKLVLRSPDPEEAAYLYWILRTPQYRADCAGHAMGSAVVALSRRDFLGFPVPPLGTARKQVVSLLEKLDDKIELNRRMNETLEAMARALFKSWFVDFDPVRAKAEGRDPGLPRPIADLFPDSFEDSELGEIPKGWEAAPLPHVMDVNPARTLRSGDMAPYLDMANMPTRGHSPDRVIDRPYGSGMRFVNGDTLVARLTPCLENGKTAYVDFLKEGEVGWGSTEYIVLHPKPPLPAQFGYCLARSEEFRAFAVQRMTGSSGRQRVPAESLFHFLVVSPPETIAQLFGRTVAPLFSRASAASLESRTLAALRDTLLPKLISGELRVKDAERFLDDRGL